MPAITIGSSSLKYAFASDMRSDSEVITEALGNGVSEAIDTELTNSLLYFLEEKTRSVGFITNILVNRASRGQGIGKQLMQQYMDTIGKDTKIDFLFASTYTPQLEGFNLIKFYEQFGFRQVTASDGEVLMVTKGHENELMRYIGAYESAEMMP